MSRSIVERTKRLEFSKPHDRGKRKIDLTGQRFGRLVVIRESEDRAFHKKVYWICQCDCGEQRSVMSGHLRSGKTKSCGCSKGESHGLGGTQEYWVWSAMINRCHNPKYRQFEYYGGRGITVCDEWRSSFTAFIEDMGRRPSPDLTIERINNNLGYSKANCKWATRSEQAFNRRPKSR